MNRFLFGVLSLGLVVTGCVKDPTEDLRTGVDRVTTTRTYLQLTPGDSASVSARTLDVQGNPIVPLPTLTSSDANVATITIDEEVTGNPLPQVNFFVKGGTPGEATVTATAEAASSAIQTLVFPLVFPGTAVATTVGRLDQITVTPEAIVEFDTSGTSGVLVDGASADVTSLTASEMVASWSAPEAKPAAVLTLTDVLFLGEFPTAALDLEATVALKQDTDEPANNNDVPGGGTLTVGAFDAINRGSSSSSDIDDFWCVSHPGGDITFEIGWGGTGADADIDVFVEVGCTQAFSFSDITGFAMATGANPETASVTGLAAGDVMVYINVWDPHGVPDPFWYHLRVFPTPT
jgi:hypothetical protein